MNRSFEVCWYCPTNLDIDKFQESTEVLSIMGVLEWGFPLRVSQLCKNIAGLNCLLLIIVVPTFCGQDNLLGGKFWAMGRLNLLGGQINLLGGHLICYLPPCYKQYSPKFKTFQWFHLPFKYSKRGKNKSNLIVFFASVSRSWVIHLLTENLTRHNKSQNLI